MILRTIIQFPSGHPDSESALFNLTSKLVWNKVTNVREVSDLCTDIFPSHNTHKQNSINYIRQRTQPFTEALQSSKQTQGWCLVFTFNHLLMQPEVLFGSGCFSCSPIWPADNFPPSDCGRAVRKEPLGAAAGATKASTGRLAVWPCTACLRVKGATITQSAQSLWKWDLACGRCWTRQARSASGKGANRAVLVRSTKSSKLKPENFLTCFRFPFPFYWQITPIYICPRSHVKPLQTQRDFRWVPVRIWNTQLEKITGNSKNSFQELQSQISTLFLLGILKSSLLLCGTGWNTAEWLLFLQNFAFANTDCIFICFW